MEKPQFYTNEKGEVLELQPVKVDGKALEAELNQALKAKTEIDANVKKLEAEVEDLTSKLSDVNTILAKQQDAQDEAAELVAFRRGRLEAFNSPHPLNQAVVDGTASPAAEDVAGDPDGDDDPDTEELADGDEAGGVDVVETEEMAIPIRRRVHE